MGNWYFNSDIFILNAVFQWELPFSFENKNALLPDTLRATYQQINEHNKNLLALLQTKISDESNQIGERDAIIWQMRGFYILIIGVLLSVLLSVEIKKKNSIPLFKIQLIIICAMYSLEVHQIDLNERLRKPYEIYHKELESLINLDKYNKKWYTFSYYYIGIEMNRTSNF